MRHTDELEHSTYNVPFFAKAGAGLLQPKWPLYPCIDGRGSHGPFGPWLRWTRLEELLQSPVHGPGGAGGGGCEPEPHGEGARLVLPDPM